MISKMALIIGVGKLSYMINSAAWDGKLDDIFNIPGEVLLIFSIFGILGYYFIPLYLEPLGHWC